MAGALAPAGASPGRRLRNLQLAPPANDRGGAALVATAHAQRVAGGGEGPAVRAGRWRHKGADQERAPLGLGGWPADRRGVASWRFASAVFSVAESRGR